LGADQAINYKNQDFEKILQQEGVDVILDMIGADYFQIFLNILKPDGRLVQINSVKSDQVSFSIHQVMNKRLTITGSTLRGREYSFKKKLAQSVLQHVWPLIQEGKFKTIIYKILPFTEAAAAHRLLEESEHTGKIVLVWE